MGLTCAVEDIAVENPDLPEVATDDRPLVRDVLAVLSTVGVPGPPLVRTWTVTLEGVHIIVHGLLDARGADWVIGYDDLDSLRQLDMYRVQPSVRGSPQGGPVQIVVKVTTRAVPVSVTECVVTRVTKRRRWLNWGV